MAIGDVRIKPGSSVQDYQNPRVTEESFGSGVARGLNALGDSLGALADARDRLARAYQLREKKKTGFSVEEQYIRWAGEQNKLSAERYRNSPADGSGVTNLTEEEQRKAGEAFLSSIPAEFRDEYRVKIADFQTKHALTAFDFEWKAGNEFFRTTATRVLNEQLGLVYSGEVTPDEARSTISGLVEKSDLPEAEKITLSETINQAISAAEFQKETEKARMGGGTVRPADGSDVVATGLTAGERAFLNATAVGESAGKYNVINGGVEGNKYFDDYSWHPGIASKTADGRTTTAAGRYQFLLGTWNWVAEKLGLTDFSPESQDRAAAWYAKYLYNKQIGPGDMTFDQVMSSGNRQLIASMRRVFTAGNGGWEAFDKMSDDQFANLVMGGKGLRTGGTGSADAPDIWNDPRFAGLTYDQKMSLATKAQNTIDERDRIAAAAGKAAAQAAQDAVFLGATQGKYTAEDEQDLIKQGILTKGSEVTHFRALIKEGETARREASALAAAMRGGFGYYSSEAEKGANRLLEEGQVISGLQAGDEQAGAAVSAISRTLGTIPSDASETLNNMLLGNNFGMQKFAADLLTSMQKSDPYILSRSKGMSEDAQKIVATLGTLREYYSEDDVMKRFREMRDPQMREQYKAIREEAGKYFDKELTIDHVLESIEPAWHLGDQPKPPMGAAQQAVLMKDFRLLFTEGYALFSDTEAAREYAAKMVKQVWVESTIGQTDKELFGLATAPILTKNGAERFYPPVGQKYDWINYVVREEFGYDSNVEFQLVADSQTVAEGQAYRNPNRRPGQNNASYLVVRKVETPFGTQDAIEVGPDGMPVRLWFEVPKRVTEQLEYDARETQLEERIFQLAADGLAEGNRMDPKILAQIESTKVELEELRSGQVGLAGRSVVPERTSGDVENNRAKVDAIDKRLEHLKPLMELSPEFYKPTFDYLTRQKEKLLGTYVENLPEATQAYVTRKVDDVGKIEEEMKIIEDELRRLDMTSGIISAATHPRASMLRARWIDLSAQLREF